MTETKLPILYSFRRCPYAMRARLAIAYSGIKLELREIVLRNKPEEMLAISPKGTVPVLQLPSGEVIDESIDIMRWALAQHDPKSWYSEPYIPAIESLITQNDESFKPWLDRYKYADRYPEQSETYYRNQCEAWFKTLESLLEANKGFLVTDQITLADMALLPFIRQCAHVDLAWFESTQYTQLQNWLNRFKDSELFSNIMQKYPAWQRDDPKTLFP